jgi:hypothetical protein
MQCKRGAKGGGKQRKGVRDVRATMVCLVERGRGAAAAARPRLRPASCDVANPREVAVALERRSGALEAAEGME